MVKMEWIIMGVFLLHMIFMFVILRRTKVSVRLLKKLLNATTLGNEGMGYNSIVNNSECEVYQTDELGKNKEETVNDVEYANISADMEMQEKEKLINDVLSEIFC